MRVVAQKSQSTLFWTRAGEAGNTTSLSIGIITLVCAAGEVSVYRKYGDSWGCGAKLIWSASGMHSKILKSRWRCSSRHSTDATFPHLRGIWR